MGDIIPTRVISIAGAHFDFKHEKSCFHPIGDARGAHSMVVEKASEAITGQLQRASGDCRRQAHVSGCVCALSVHHSGQRLL
jgi:hypothetical protein